MILHELFLNLRSTVKLFTLLTFCTAFTVILESHLRCHGAILFLNNSIYEFHCEIISLTTAGNTYSLQY